MSQSTNILHLFLNILHASHAGILHCWTPIQRVTMTTSGFMLTSRAPLRLRCCERDVPRDTLVDGGERYKKSDEREYMGMNGGIREKAIKEQQRMKYSGDRVRERCEEIGSLQHNQGGLKKEGELRQGQNGVQTRGC